MRVVSPATAHDRAHPADGAYVENVMWEQSKTVFVTMNVPGGSNNDTDAWYTQPHPPVEPNQSERDDRVPPPTCAG